MSLIYLLVFTNTYLLLCSFIRMVKSKTPKVTYFSDQAKCMLMESAEDFEAIFYSGKLRVNICSCICVIY